MDVEVDGFVGFAGNRLGAIRDAKGRAVGEVFKDLGGAQKAEVSYSYPWNLIINVNNRFRSFERWRSRFSEVWVRAFM